MEAIGRDISSENRIVSVAFPIAISGLYDYAVPVRFAERAVPGTPVLVEVRSRRTWGVIINVKSHSNYPNLKEIVDIKADRWIDSNRSLIRLYEWIADYYKCDLGRVFRPLVGKGIINKSAKKVFVYGSVDKDMTELKEHHREALVKIRALQCDLPRKKIEEQLKIKPSTVTLLIKKGYLEKKVQTVVREATELQGKVYGQKIVLTDEQRIALERMGDQLSYPAKPFLLHGITGSGKTHVYTELVANVLERGKSAIILVPEISLTPQTIRRFREALGDIITVIHSNMSDGERRDSIKELVNGTKRVVIGVRSAILVPINNLGLIIVDEEHDNSYKQSDLDPRYNARDVAVMRGHFQNALVVLGSATPSFESYQNARSGKYQLIILKNRFGRARLPNVEIVDMRQEHKDNNWTLVSRYLEARMHETLRQNRQVILLLNRRGFSTVLLCKDCGYAHMCADCSVTLRYHRADTTLKCHFCGHEEPAPQRCPSCGGEKIKYKGSGIQKAEELLRQLLPNARILRMDQDSTRRKGAHCSILDMFGEKKADILLGTQMVAKGLDFPGVALVGVLQADTGLHFPDFRASERTFQLLAQVAGRAGRNDNLGEVVIQTYFPDESSLRFAQVHDFEGFFGEEIEPRKELGYPPFSKLARILIEGENEREVISLARKLGRVVRTYANVTVLGPAPAAIMRIKKEFRYSLLLKASSHRSLSILLNQIRASAKKIPKEIKVIIDVDPVNML